MRLTIIVKLNSTYLRFRESILLLKLRLFRFNVQLVIRNFLHASNVFLPPCIAILLTKKTRLLHLGGSVFMLTASPPLRMTGALSVLGALGDRHELCRSNIITEARLYTYGFGRRQQNKGKQQKVMLGGWNVSARVFRGTCSWRYKKRHSLVVVDEFAGQYEENFADVGKHLLDYFTFKAVKTVLTQLYEMNPTDYRWFYNYVANNKPSDGKRFIRLLVQEKQELGERVMVTRLHLFNKWAKRYNHGDMHKAITDQNLELMRERLVQTIRWPSDSESDDENNG